MKVDLEPRAAVPKTVHYTARRMDGDGRVLGVNPVAGCLPH
jgi:hypothetical protein